jgi:hypothetical protein
VNRFQAPTVGRWLDTREVSASLLRLNGTPDKPRAFVFLRVRPREGGARRDACGWRRGRGKSGQISLSP